jgi:hypothetical protein
MPEHGLMRGQVGTIVETLYETTAFVEFSDDHGRAYAIAPCARDACSLCGLRRSRREVRKCLRSASISDTKENGLGVAPHRLGMSGAVALNAAALLLDGGLLASGRRAGGAPADTQRYFLF